MLIMAGVFEQLFRPQQKTIYQDQKAMELEAAKEILAEVFRVRLSEVDEMIRCRFEAEDMGYMASRVLALNTTFGTVLIKGYVLVFFLLKLLILLIGVGGQHVLFVNFHSCH